MKKTEGKRRDEGRHEPVAFVEGKAWERRRNGWVVLKGGSGNDPTGEKQTEPFFVPKRGEEKRRWGRKQARTPFTALRVRWTYDLVAATTETTPKGGCKRRDLAPSPRSGRGEEEDRKKKLVATHYSYAVGEE